MIESVSSHFNYSEEYVISHSIDWVFRKQQQANREQWEQSTIRTQEGYKSLLLLVDSVFNKGKNFNDILPSSFEEALQSVKDEDTQSENSPFVQGQWWKKD